MDVPTHFKRIFSDHSSSTGTYLLLLLAGKSEQVYLCAVSFQSTLNYV